MERECRKISCSRLKQRVEIIASRGRDTVSRALSTSAIWDGVKHGQMCFIHDHSNTPPHPPRSTPFLHRAPRSLGSALLTTLFKKCLSELCRSTVVFCWALMHANRANHWVLQSDPVAIYHAWIREHLLVFSPPLIWFWGVTSVPWLVTH